MPIYLPDATVVYTFYPGSPIVNKIVFTQLATAPTPEIVSDYLAAGKGPTSSSTAPGASIKVAVILQSYGFHYELWNGNKDYTYDRSSFAYVAIYEPSTTVGQTIVRLVKVNETSDTFLGEYTIPEPCPSISGKNNRLVCANGNGYTIYSFTESTAEPYLVEDRKVQVAMGANPAACMVSNTEVLFIDSANNLKVDNNGATAMNLGVADVSPNYVLNVMHDGCFYAGNLDGSNQVLVFYGDTYKEINRDLLFFKAPIPYAITSRLDAQVIEGVFFYHAQSNFAMLPIHQPGVYTLKSTKDITYVPLTYNLPIPPGRAFPLFGHLDDFSRIQLATLTSTAVNFKGITAKPFKMDCYLPTKKSGEMSQDFSFLDGQARNPRYSIEGELLVIVRYPNVSYSYGSSEIGTAKILLIVTAIISMLCLSALLVYKTLAVRKLNKINPPRMG